MIRVLVILALTALLAVGAQWLTAHPGVIVFTWLGYRVETPVFVALALVLAAALALGALWALIRFVFRLPKVLSIASRLRQRERGYESLSRGLIAVGAGDARVARREAAQAARLLRHEPMTLLLQAQSAQLSGDSQGARALFAEMAKRPETRVLGLRGLYVEARRAGERDAAFAFAEQAQAHAPAAWAGQALIERAASEGDWETALAALERSAAGGQIDKPDLARARSALKLAMAQERADREPEAARALAAQALADRPDLAPAAALLGKLLARRGDLRKAAKTIEKAWARGPHPDLAQAYVDLRPGDSSLDRLARARKLAKTRPDDPESRLTIALAATAAREFAEARAALAPMIEGEAAAPTARVCAAMAQLEEADGHPAKAREWWGRAARAPRDKAWIADGMISDVWRPVSPATGEPGAYEWRAPDERLAPPIDLPASIFEPLPAPPQAHGAADALVTDADEDGDEDGEDAAPAIPPSPALAAGASPPPALKADPAGTGAGQPDVAKVEASAGKGEAGKGETGKGEAGKPIASSSAAGSGEPGETIKPLAPAKRPEPGEPIVSAAAEAPAKPEAQAKPDAPAKPRPEPVVFALSKAPDDPGVRP